MISMRSLFLIKLAFLVALLPFRSLALSQSDPSYWNMNRALSGVTQSAMEARGFTASDPRYFGTTKAMGQTAITSASSAAGLAAGAGMVTLAGATAPAWASVLLVATVSAVVGFGVNLALNGLVNWLFRGDKKIDETVGAGSVDSSNGITAGGQGWRASDNVNFIWGGDYTAVGNQARYNIAARGGQAASFQPATCTQTSTYQASCGSVVVSLLSAAPGTCPPGSFWMANACSVYGFAAGGNYTAQTLQQAIDRIPASERSKPLNPQIVANVANQLWQQAASQPGYQGLPYPVSNPITAAEAQTWQSANAGYWPTVGDFVSPVATADTGAYSMVTNPTATTPTPATGTSPTSVNPSTQAQINLGEDPGVGKPTLEGTPTAQQILAPITGLLPDLRSLTVPAHTSACPQPVLSLWGKSMTVTAHCELTEANKGVIQAGMALAWALLALFIVLSA